MSLSLEERVIHFIALAEKCKFLEAIEQFYEEDAVIQDNEGPQRVGLGHILEHERKLMAGVTTHTSRADSFLIDGDRRDQLDLRIQRRNGPASPAERGSVPGVA